MKDFAVRAVLWLKSWKERRTPMRAVLALNACIMLSSIDAAKTKIFHKMIDVSQNMTEGLEKQSQSLHDMEHNMIDKISHSKDQYEEMVQTYTSFLETVKKYNDTWVGQ